MAHEPISARLRRKPGPKPTGEGQLVIVRLSPADLAALDAYASSTGGLTRPQAIRAILIDALIGQGFIKHRDELKGTIAQHLSD